MQKYANLVELEKCCQTHTSVYSQKLVSIQPRTSPPKNCKILLIFPILTPERREAPRAELRDGGSRPAAHGAVLRRRPGQAARGRAAPAGPRRRRPSAANLANLAKNLQFGKAILQCMERVRRTIEIVRPGQ